eukprot:TRINITY_DN5360_c0_g1_i1.p1 TRINITY_DN5360_c0_g1~~TRINITY_DN5360_c0_g1_i1.p1  ORF type:complete len:347 (+),score=198.80 TRINITY_DN5360_c0_g1_i1:40-1041(+)
MASTDITFVDDAAAKQAFTELRSNDHPTNWVLFTYSDSAKNQLDFIGAGTGGIEQLKTHLEAGKASYGMVRVTDQIDNSVTVKFVFVFWCGENVPFVRKAQITTHKGSVTTLFGQYHNDISASNLEELTENDVMTIVRNASGTAHHVKESVTSNVVPVSSTGSFVRGAASNSSPKIVSTKNPGVPKESAGNVKFIDEEAIQNSIKAVRANNDETDWTLIGYEGKTNNIKLVGSGAGGLDELISHLKEDEILYGIYRTTDTIDNTVAIKFVLIIWVGEKVPIIRKARITTHKGDITSFVGQYHVDVNCSNLEEINEEIIRDLVQRASGTANLVK